MELSVLYGFTIFLLTISLMEHVRAAAIDIPLISKLNAPLKAELDISILTTQLKELIGNEVKQAVSEAMKDLAENIVDNKTQSAVENLQTSNNLTISTLLKEIEDVAAMKESDVRTMKEKLQGDIEQMKEKQKITESKISAVEAEFEKSTKRDVTARKNDVRIMEENLEKSIEQQKITESKLSSVEAQLKSSTKRVAMTAHPSSHVIITNTIMKFEDVKYSVGITNLSTFQSTGKFTCEHEGLYVISASVISKTTGAYYYIRLNGNDISLTSIGQFGGIQVFTGAVTVTRKLNPNDQVWLYAAGSWFLYGGMYSKLTIIKIK